MLNGLIVIGRKMAECPYCGYETKKIRKEWNYQVYRVKHYFCDRCERTFMGYYKNGILNHTIPKIRKK